jgi:Flp pilus assembly protein TadG
VLRRFPARRARAHHGQSLVEFALLAPLLVLVMLVTIDFSRLVYIYGAISWSAREGARLATLPPQQISDCAALTEAESSAQGFTITPDPSSIVGDSDPNLVTTTTPPNGQAYVYVYPAVATAAPVDANCSGSSNRQFPNAAVHDVAVQVEYRYTPLVPMISTFFPNLTIRSICVTRAEY